MNAKEIQKKIKAYNLMDQFRALLDIAIDGGCPAPSTIYAAFNSQNESAREEAIVQLAKRVVEAHEEKIEQAITMTAQPAAV